MKEKTLKAILSEFESLIRQVEQLGCDCPGEELWWDTKPHKGCGRKCMGQQYTAKARRLLAGAKKELDQAAKR